MTDTTSILSKPGIKCFPEKPKLYDTAQVNREKITRLTEEEMLRTGESAHRVGNHHVEQHYTVYGECNYIIKIHCHGNNKLCNCKFFIPRSVGLSYSNRYKMVTEGLTDV